MLPRVFFTVDGHEAPLAGWRCSSSAFIGFDQFRGTAAASRARRIIGGIEQGSVVTAYTEHSPIPIWEGVVSQPPQITQESLAHVAAQGYGHGASKSGNRVTPIITNPGAWIPASLAPVYWPMAAPITDMVVTNTAATRRIQITASGGANWAIAFVARGMNLNRFSASLSPPATDDLWRLWVATLPDVLKTARLVAVLSNTSEETFERRGIGNTLYSVGFAPSDVVILEMHDPRYLNPGVAGETITDPKVWGDYDFDVIYSHHGARIVARQLGWDPSGITGRGAAPLGSSDWEGDGAGYMSYIAGLEDFSWGLWFDTTGGSASTPTPLCTFDRYGGPGGRRTWEVSARTGATWDLVPLERIRRVRGQYLNIDNTLSEITLEADEGALPASVDNEVGVALLDSQENATLAFQSGYRTLRHMLEQRYRGRVTFAHAYELDSGRDAPYEVRGGDLLRISDFSVDGALTVRVHDVELSPGGVSVGSEARALASGSLAGAAPRSGGALARALTSVTHGVATYIPPGSSAGGSTGGGGGSPDSLPDFGGPIKWRF